MIKLVNLLAGQKHVGIKKLHFFLMEMNGLNMMGFAEIVICDSLNLLITGVSYAKEKICNF